MTIRTVVELVALSVGWVALVWLLARLVRTAEFPARPLTRSIVELRAVLLYLYTLMIANRAVGDFPYRREFITGGVLTMSFILARQVVLFEQEQRAARRSRRRPTDPER